MRKEKKPQGDISPTQRAVEQSVTTFSKKMLKTSLIVSVLEWKWLGRATVEN